MLLVAWGLLKQFWKPLLLIIIITYLGFKVNAWDNDRLNASFKAGQKSVEEFYANAEREAIAKSEAMSEQIRKDLFHDLEKQKSINVKLDKQIQELNKKEVYTCSPTPEYLSLWDATNQRNTLDEGNTSGGDGSDDSLPAITTTAGG